MDDIDVYFGVILILFLLECVMFITVSVTGYAHGKGVVYEKLLEQHNVTQPAEEVTEL